MDFKIIHIDETDSTNRWLKEHRDSSLASLSDVTKEPSLCVVADYQTAGKGCGTNSWESERGKNLTFSVMLHPVEIPASGQFRISEAVSVALCTTLETYIYNKVEIKWPNDIYVGDQKICGILIENRLQGNPVSMYQLVGHEMDRTALLDAFLEALDEAMDSETVGTDYRSRLYRRDGFYDYRDGQGDFQAKLLNVLDDGRLVLLDTEGTARLYAFKEVQYII